VRAAGRHALPAEFRLVAACCIWPPSEHRNAAIRQAASGTVDWDNVLQVTRRQRVAGLVYDGLKCAEIVMPAAVSDALAAGASDVARRSLLLASEALRLQDVFAAASIPVMFVKGTALAQLAYGNIAIKQAYDIDVLVTPDAVVRACAVLDAAGYKRTFPTANVTPERFATWTEFSKECVFQHDRHGVIVELHWRLADNPAVLRGVTANSASRAVAVSPGRALRTLGDEDLFAYLCFHGAQHAWSRLKWLADLAAWLAAKPPQDVERLCRTARAAGTGRAPDQALLLCEELFGTPLPPSLAATMPKDRVNLWLVSIALSAMAGGGATQQTHDRPFGNLEIFLSHFLLAPGFWQELHTKAIGGVDFDSVALPRPLFFLYPVLRVPSWIWRRALHLVGQSRVN
jgi:hypothetical protein